MRALGNKGEEHACKILKKKHYKILERNFTVKGGEIDIIAMDKDCLVFVEVKMRKSDAFGRPSEYVGREKQRHLLHAASCYGQMTGYMGPCRFDVVEIFGEVTRFGYLRVRDVNHIQNAFDA